MKISRPQDLLVALVITLVGLYLIVYGVQAISETMSAREVSATNTYTTMLLLTLPLIGVALIGYSMLMLMR